MYVTANRHDTINLTGDKFTLELNFLSLSLLPFHQGDKRREQSGPSEMVACTSCEGNTPCTHTASSNNGCATEVISNFNGLRFLLLFISCSPSHQCFSGGWSQPTKIYSHQKFLSRALWTATIVERRGKENKMEIYQWLLSSRVACEILFLFRVPLHLNSPTTTTVEFCASCHLAV